MVFRAKDDTTIQYGNEPRSKELHIRQKLGQLLAGHSSILAFAATAHVEYGKLFSFLPDVVATRRVWSYPAGCMMLYSRIQ